MSIGILQIPSVCDPAYSPLYFLVSGSMSAQNNYKIIALIKDLGGNTLAKVKQPTDSVYTTKAAFDLHRILENYVTHTIDMTAVQVTKANNNYIGFVVEFGEEYGSPTTAEYYYSTQTATLLSPNIALSPKDFLSFDSSTYFLGSGTRLFLNKFKGTRKVFTTTKSFLYFMQEMNSATSLVTGIKVVAKNSAGATLATTVIGQPWDGTQDDMVFLYFPSGPANLNLIPQAQLTSGTEGSVIPAATSTYLINLVFNSGQNSEILTFSIEDSCSKYDNYPIYFLGQYGQVETWNFNKKSYKSSDIQRSTFKSTLGGFLTATTYGFSQGERQETQYNTEVTDSIVINTDLLNDAEYLLMKELIQSPQVWVLEGTTLVSIVIKETNYLQKTKVNDKIFNFTISFSYSSTLELQRY